MRFAFQKNKKQSKLFTQRGFTLMETLIGVAIFVGVSLSIYGGFVKVLNLMNIIRTKETVTNLVTEQFEIARNLPYSDVGTVNGVPTGVLLQNQTLVRDNKTFNVDTIVRNFDDPFDGTLGGSPNDLSPADMKLIEVTVSCPLCKDYTTTSFTTKIAPKNLETASTNGALVVRVFDSGGLPVSGATVDIVNTAVSPNINMSDTTGVDGTLTIVDAPPSVDGYNISVSKSGYSSAQTYPVGGGGNPNPSQPDLTVVLQQITQVSFTIDKVSTVPITSVNSQCSAVANFDFDFIGAKLIGTNPDTLKYSNSLTTNGSGTLTLNNIEWDTYEIEGTDGTNDIIGTNPLLPINIAPDATQNIQIMTAAKNGNRLVVVVRDQSTGLPVTDAVVTLDGPNSYVSTATTNEGFFTQTSWVDGPGQTDMGDPELFFVDDGNIDYTNSPGNLELKQLFGNYVSSGNLESSTFDTGGPSNFRQLVWTPGTQPVQSGVDSVRFQVASNIDNATWNFVGPDGTANTYFSSSNQNIGAFHDGNQYFRYKLFLSTLDPLYTPSVSDISFTYTSSCIPPGQVSFAGLATGNYDIEIVTPGYQDATRSISISTAWQKEEFNITP